MADHIYARQHLARGQVFVILHDTQNGGFVQIDRNAWAVLERTDGTRDLEGVALAMSRIGPRPGHATLEAFFGELDALGMLVDGPPMYDPDAAPPQPRPAGCDPQRPIVPLPDYRWQCDGSGGCCSWFGSIQLTPADARRALAVWADSPIPDLPLERLLMPYSGSAPQPIRVPALRDGACCFLQTDGGCGIHARAGAAAKPFGCSSFPQRLVDDGVEVRASVVTECACVLDPATDAAEPVTAMGLVVADVPALERILSLPETIGWTERSRVPREHLRAWIHAHLAYAAPDDGAAWCWSLADAIESAAGEEPCNGTQPRAWLVELHRRAQKVHAQESAWRSGSDLGHLALAWVVLASQALAEGTVELLPPDPAERPREALFIRAAWWGYLDAERFPWTRCLRDRAIRLWLGRAMSSLRPHGLDTPAFRHPLALVDAILRARGLGSYMTKPLEESSRR